MAEKDATHDCSLHVRARALAPPTPPTHPRVRITKHIRTFAHFPLSFESVSFLFVFPSMSLSLCLPRWLSALCSLLSLSCALSLSRARALSLCLSSTDAVYKPSLASNWSNIFKCLSLLTRSQSLSLSLSRNGGLLVSATCMLTC